MINVTERAKEKLKELKSQSLSQVNVEASNLGLRLDHASPGQLGIFPDAHREGDQVVEHEGAAVLFVGQAIAQAVNGTTIDCEGDGAQLVIKAPARKN
jgi:Fe-S cluster assembly iron-binding protein IscA